MEIGHSRIGASSAPRYWYCAGSVNLISKVEKLPTYSNEQTKYALEGVAAHLLCELCLLKNEEADQWIGEPLEVDEKIIHVTEGMASAVQVYLDTIQSDIKKYNVNRSFLQVEKSFELLSVDLDAYGTNDACLHVPYDRIIVYDYKHGQGVIVEVSDNKQLKYYGLGAMQGKKDISVVETKIVQPRVTHPDGMVRGQTYSLAEMEKYRLELRSKIAATKFEDASLRTGKHCKFCPAITVCTAVHKDVRNTAMTEFSPIPVVVPNAEILSIDQLGDILDKIPVVQDFFFAVAAQAEKFALAGIKVKGQKLVRKNKNRVWIDKKYAKEVLVRLIGSSMYSNTEIKSPAKLEKLMKELGLLATFNELVHKPEGELTLVKEADPRDAFIEAASEFKEVKE